MNVKKTAKKIAALVAGTTMIGATIMGAMAYTLADYPAPFVTNGVADAKLVVGAKASTSDVMGAIDIAASLQANAKTTTKVEVPGVAGTTTVTGDSAQFKTGSDIVAIGETIGSVKGTFTSSDLEGLKSGVFTAGSTSTPVKQYLKFDGTTASVAYQANADDLEGDYLKYAQDSSYFEYHMEFTEGAVSDVTSGDLLDFESESLTIMGVPYTIVDAKNITASTIELTLMGGQVADTLKDGQTKTYTIDGKDYEVTAVFIDSSSSSKAKLSVNGMLTKELAEGATEVLGDVTVGVQEILTNQREGLVEFYLGASKVVLKDTDFTSTTYGTEGTVKVGGESIDNAYLIIKATAGAGQLTLNYIKYKVLADDDKYIPAKHGVKEYLLEKDAMLSSNWDIYYAGLTTPGTTEIKLNPVSSHSYKLEFENLNGGKYSVPYVTDKSGAHKGFSFGDSDDDLIFKEATLGATNAGNGTSNSSTNIGDDDYFVVSDRACSLTEDKAVTSVMRYNSISTSENTVTFSDLAGGETKVSYTGTPGTDATGTLIVEGASHIFYVGGASTTAYKDYALTMDLNADGDINADEVMLVTKGGAILDLGTQTFNTSDMNDSNAIASTYMNITMATPSARFDEASEGGIALSLQVGKTATANKLTATVNGTLIEHKEDDKYSSEMTSYGALVTKYTPTSSSAIDEITVEYPLAQRYAQVFTTMGSISVSESTGSGDGSLETTTVNVIPVGLAVKDTDVKSIGTQKLIVVGGPCANTVAFELMGKPEVCGAGFTPGKATIKLFADKNALLVAGYEAQETLGAAYVLSAYKDYKLTGTEVEVSAADLSTLSIKAVQ